MFTDFIILLGATMVSLITWLFSIIPFVIPDYIETVISTAFSYLARLQPIFPMVSNPAKSGLWGVVGIYDLVYYALTVIIALYIVKLIISLLGFLPWIGKHFQIPSWGHHDIDEKEEKIKGYNQRFRKTMSGRGINTRFYQRKRK